MIYGFIAICLFGKALAEVPTNDCSKVQRMPHLNRTAVLGWWYEWKTSNRSLQFPCSAMSFSIKDDKEIIAETYLDETVWETFNDNHTAINITGDHFWTTHILLPDPNTDIHRIADYILDTDYTSYVIVVHCLDSQQTLGVYTREFSPDKTVLDTVDNIIKEKNLTHIKLFPNLKKCELPTDVTSDEWKYDDDIEFSNVETDRN